MAGKFCGRGRRIKVDGEVYIGEFKDDKPHGFGSNLWPGSAGHYEGFYYMDNKHAYGKYTFDDGENYEGEYQEDKYQGHGILTYANGNRYRGPFKNHLQHGIGFDHLNGQIYKVEYSEGKFVRELDFLSDSSDEEEEGKKKMRESAMGADDVDDGTQLFRVYRKYDIVDTEVRLLHRGAFLNFQVRPFKFDSTKVIMWVSGTEERKEFVLKGRNYQGSL